MSACSRRSSLSRYVSTRASSDVTSGCISDRSADCAACRSGSDTSSKCYNVINADIIWEFAVNHTRVVWRIFVIRGKSFTPESSVCMDESSSTSDSRSDDTHPSRAWFIVVSGDYDLALCARQLVMTITPCSCQVLLYFISLLFASCWLWLMGTKLPRVRR